MPQPLRQPLRAKASEASGEREDTLREQAQRVLTSPMEAGRSGGAHADGFFPLRLRDTPVGVLYIAPPGDNQPRLPQEQRTIHALANYTAAVIGRQNAAEETQKRIQTVAVTEERNRLTREIHDTVAQSLTGIVILLQAADGAGPEEQSAVITQAGHLAQDCLAEARRSVRALRPGALEGRDLPSALRELADRTGRSGGPRTLFSLSGDAYTLPTEYEANIFRIAQESLTNALRHARADEIRIGLTYRPDAVHLCIEDDGCGIETKRAAGPGFGMTSMRERASQMAAILTVEPSEKGSGTLVSLSLPIAANRCFGRKRGNIGSWQQLWKPEGRRQARSMIRVLATRPSAFRSPTIIRLSDRV